MVNTREHIINTALTLFLQKSFKEVTMSELVKQSGMSKGAFYHYFDSKEGLFREVVNTAAEISHINFDQIQQTTLKQFYENYLSLIKETKSESTFMRIIGNSPTNRIKFTTLLTEANRLFPEFTDVLLKLHENELNGWIKIVERAIEIGEIRTKMPAQHIAEIFVNISNGITKRSRLYNSQIEIASRTKVLWDSFYEELRT
ncbi:TetR/AcrR family transcriptional regulator [Gottfriedia sp. NPDC056225]|uniref:TetR/AcrR family transcriptional regulator n=1 Tax=Gottfriedia sp. NPDC056225 TaxID=3345751 RepID=UPI0035DACA9A